MRLPVPHLIELGEELGEPRPRDRDQTGDEIAPLEAALGGVLVHDVDRDTLLASGS